jgi:16S rRNA pseudouridine516 synthase
MSEKIKSLRLDRLLSNMGYGSRREIHELAELGLVTLDGKTLIKADQRIAVTPDLPSRMRVASEAFDPLPGMIVMLHKPLGVSCSHKESGKIVYDLFPERWQRRDPPLSTIGRLDKETSGLLLLTDDGIFLHRIISPRSNVTKRYHVTLAVPLRGNEQKIFASGEMMLEGEDKPLLPVILETLSPTTAYVTLTEGRYHQIRRMFTAMNNEVIVLHRDHIGGLVLPEDLKPGDYQLLRPHEIQAITQ